jgi:hypothetical protein
MSMKHLEHALTSGRAKSDYGSYIIYSHRFTLGIMLEALLAELEPSFDIVQLFPGVLKAISKR